MPAVPSLYGGGGGVVSLLMNFMKLHVKCIMNKIAYNLDETKGDILINTRPKDIGQWCLWEVNMIPAELTVATKNIV